VNGLWETLSGLPPEVITMIIGSLPVSELRGAIPIGITLGDLSWQSAWLFAVIGNALPVVPLLFWLEPISNWLRRWPVWERFFVWLFARTRRRGGLIEKYGAWGLILFVSIPLPVTGAWTGCAAAFVFGIRPGRALPLVLGGILIASVVVTLLTLGGIEGAGLFTK